MSPFFQVARLQACQKVVTCLLIAVLIAWTGCSSRKSEKPKDEESRKEQPADAEETSAPQPEKASAEKSQQPGETKPSASGAAAGAGTLEPVRRPTEGGGSGRAAETKEADSEAMKILQAMAKAYWEAKSYEDAGYARIYVDIGDRPSDEKIDASVAFERPNRLRAHIGSAMVVCDGNTFWSALRELPGQIVRIPAPRRLTVPFLLADPEMMKTLGRGPTGLPPQLALLMQKDALKGVLADHSGLKVLPPEKIDETECNRIEIMRPDGKMVLWIDTASNVLRRVELPTDGLRQIIEQQAKVKNISLTLELVGARLNSGIDPTAFRFEAPEGAQFVSFFTPPHPLGLLGKPVPDMTFTTLDGKQFPLTPQTCKGKATVLFCWATWCEPCKKAFPKIEEAYAKLKENPKVQFIGVNVDDPKVTDAEIQKKVADLGATFPIVRDIGNVVPDRLVTTSIPTFVIIGPKGDVQYYQPGIPEDVVPQLMSDVGAVLGGRDLFADQLKYYQSQIESHAKQIEAVREAAVDQIEAPKTDVTRAEIAPRTEPANFKLKTLWRSTTVKSPGNVLVDHRGDGPPGIFAIDGWKGLAEFSDAGEVVKRIPFDIPKNGIVGILHEYVAPSGEKFFIGTAGAQKQCYVFDSAWKTVAAYPADGLTRPDAAAVSDARLVTAPGARTPTLCVSYWDRPAVDGVTFNGKSVWQADLSHPIMNMAALEPEAAASLCCSRSGEAAVLDAAGKVVQTIRVKGFLFEWVVAADLNMDRRMEFAAIATRKAGKVEVIGFGPDGRLLWSCPLPEGVLTQPIDPILVGKLDPDGPDCWVVPGADGSLTFIDAAGTTLDSFNTGAEIAGFAATALNGKTVFIISSPQGVEALAISQ